MKIWVDENIPLAETLFGQLGDVVPFAGRTLGPGDVQEADALVVRSVTQVNASLLAGSRVKFVGTATIGVDHLDLPWLAQQGITVCSAPGSNAQSVAEYVLSALAALGTTLEDLLAGGCVGIVGFGNVGRQVARCLAALGIAYRAYDPWLPDDLDPNLTDLDAVTASQVLCCHAPLVKDGAHPSYHLLGVEDLTRIDTGGVLLNAGRGGVLDTEALLSLKQQRPDIALVMDVWENEPAIDLSLAQQCAIATPHIAGYSLDGKIRGAVMIARALAQQLGVSLDEAVFSQSSAEIKVPASGEGAHFIRTLIHSVYDVREDDQRFRHILTGDVAAGFDRLRKDYPVRRELAACDFDFPGGLSEQQRDLLLALTTPTANL